MQLFSWLSQIYLISGRCRIRKNKQDDILFKLFRKQFKRRPIVIVISNKYCFPFFNYGRCGVIG